MGFVCVGVAIHPRGVKRVSAGGNFKWEMGNGKWEMNSAAAALQIRVAAGLSISHLTFS